MKNVIIRDGILHYTLSLLTVVTLCSISIPFLGLEAPFTLKFLGVILPVSLLVAAFDSTAPLTKPQGGFLGRILRLLLAFGLVCAFLCSLGGVLAFFVPFFRAMFVWQMLTALATSAIAIMMWRVTEGVATTLTRVTLGFFAFVVVLALAILVTKYFAASGWVINGAPKM